MRQLLLYSIRNAKESIYLTTAYFVPSSKILRALINAAQRGVDLKLLLPGRSDVMAAYYAGRSYYRRLLIAGAEIYNYQGAVLHSKTSVFDRCWNIIGSTNLDTQSLLRNDESNVGIFDSNFSSQMIDIFHNDLQNSVKIDEKTWAERPLYQKFLGIKPLCHLSGRYIHCGVAGRSTQYFSAYNHKREYGTDTRPDLRG